MNGVLAAECGNLKNIVEEKTYIPKCGSKPDIDMHDIWK